MSADPEDIDVATRPLSEADKIAAFRACTRSLPERYREEIAAGMTDAELARALEQVLGIFGGCSARRGVPSLTYKGAGLKIWAGWEYADPQDKPIFAGQATIDLARQLYRIPNPEDGQLRLF
jgi:hypothetical protein